MNDAHLLTTMLDDENVIQSHHDGQRNYKLQVRDMALAALILLHEKKLEDYDMPVHGHAGMNAMNAKGFENDEERKKAFDKWNADPLSKKNGEEAGEAAVDGEDDEQSGESDDAVETENVDKAAAEPE